jgi:hypothetical protein
VLGAIDRRLRAVPLELRGLSHACTLMASGCAQRPR